jgi:predicted O-methyltransferase YrrM
MDRMMAEAVPEIGQSEARFTRPRPECPSPEFWTSADEQATENEVLDGLYGLVRLLQPEYVVETGTHHGRASEQIGEALLKNGHGRLDTIELDPKNVEIARGRLSDLPVTCHVMDALTFVPAQPIDFAWIDSGPADQRTREFLRFYPHMHERTIVAFHDSGTHHRFIRLACLEAMRRGMLIPIFLPTPRGVALCQVVPANA